MTYDFNDPDTWRRFKLTMAAARYGAPLDFSGVGPVSRAEVVELLQQTKAGRDARRAELYRFWRRRERDRAYQARRRSGRRALKAALRPDTDW